MKKAAYTVVLLVIFLGMLVWSCSHENAKKEKAIVDKATPIGIQYFKDKFNVDVVFTSHQITSGYTGNSIALFGNILSRPDERVMVLINYRSNEIVAAQVPEGLKKQEVP